MPTVFSWELVLVTFVVAYAAGLGWVLGTFVGNKVTRG